MQVLSDVLDMPVKVAESFQAVALGAAIFGAVAAGYYPSIEKAQENMASSILKTYKSDKDNVKIYKDLYKIYKELGDASQDILRRL